MKIFSENKPYDLRLNNLGENNKKEAQDQTQRAKEILNLGVLISNNRKEGTLDLDIGYFFLKIHLLT